MSSAGNSCCNVEMKHIAPPLSLSCAHDILYHFPRWCAEGGNLICCDYCSNAFCKKCILRNLGRKELSGILESKWYCYVCSPEPLFDLVRACDRVLENIDNMWQQKRRRNGVETEEKSELFDTLPYSPQSVALDKWDHTGMDGSVLFNYSKLQVSKDITKKAKHLVDSSNILNRVFVKFLQSVTTSKQAGAVRRSYLNSFLSVLKGLRKSLVVLEDCIKEEFSDLDVSNCWENVLNDNFVYSPEADTDLSVADQRCLSDLQKLAAEHLVDDDSDSKGFTDRVSHNCRGEVSLDPRQRSETIRPKSFDTQLNMTKKLVVKLTPVLMEQDSSSSAPKTEQDTHRKDTKSEEKDSPKDEEAVDVAAAVESQESTDNSSVSALHVEEEPGSRQSPRVKTTPLRRLSDAKAKTSLSAADSHAEHTEAAAETTKEESPGGTGDASDSDEVPVALLERAAMLHSSDEQLSDGEDGAAATNTVAKKCLFWLTKNSPESMCRKRKMLDRSSESGSSSRKSKSRRESESDSSSDDQDSQKSIQHVNMRLIGKPHLVKRKEEGASRKQLRMQPVKSYQEASDSTSSSSEDDDDSASDASDQKMKPINDDMNLLGTALFQQSSGESHYLPNIKQLTFFNE